MDRGDWLPILVAVIAALPGLIALWQNRKKNEADAAKTDAETENIHAQVADRWAEHVKELMSRVTVLEETARQDAITNKNLETKIASLQRVVRAYRLENEDLKDWAERLVKQVKIHLPDMEPEPFISRAESTQPLGKP